MKINFIGYWYKKLQQGIKQHAVAFLTAEEWVKDLGAFLQKLDALQDKKNELKELSITVEYHYKKRSLDQNALMWALYDILAHISNGGMRGHEMQMVTTKELYCADLEKYAERISITAKAEYIDVILSEWSHVLEIKPIFENGFLSKHEVIALLSTSKMNVLQMAEWLDMLFNRIAYQGCDIKTGADIKKYWLEWKTYLDKKQISIFSDCTLEQYRAKNTICEASGQYTEYGEVAHIRTQRSGGSDKPENLLYLNAVVHREQHQEGWDKFCKKYPHLKNKVLNALGAKK